VAELWSPTSQIEITNEWNDLASAREVQIGSGLDVVYTQLLAPTVLQLLPSTPAASVLDVGCGVGHLTALLAPRSHSVVGIDPSAHAITVASRVCSGINNVQLLQSTVQDYTTPGNDRHTVAVANMMLHCSLNLPETLSAIRSHLVPEGTLIVTMPHPVFYPRHRGYFEMRWFNYLEEIVVRDRFALMRQEQTGFFSTYIHRPLETYLTQLIAAGFTISKFIELSDRLVGGSPNRSTEPRFIALLARLGT
jgi:2-polyprenyl-3-methyl-5-hydroxy-6-metoxy-1,4-benzoquinol methylase